VTSTTKGTVKVASAVPYDEQTDGGGLGDDWVSLFAALVSTLASFLVCPVADTRV
jgi:hypothetical protein